MRKSKVVINNSKSEKDYKFRVLTVILNVISRFSIFYLELKNLCFHVHTLFSFPALSYHSVEMRKLVARMKSYN